MLLVFKTGMFTIFQMFEFKVNHAKILNIFIFSIRLWNSLPQNLSFLRKTVHFKKELINYMSTNNLNFLIVKLVNFVF